MLMGSKMSNKEIENLKRLVSELSEEISIFVAKAPDFNDDCEIAQRIGIKLGSIQVELINLCVT